jgi:uncharacterized membrane protein YphA (DoxX/SURF4 family)
MRIVTLILRMLFGLLFTATGLNGVLMSLGHAGFMPPPAELPAAATAFSEALMDTGYMMMLISGTQLLAGVLLVIGLWVPLALTLLAPVVVNIVLFHYYLEPSGKLLAHIVLGVELFLAFCYGPSFRGVLDPRAKPRWGQGA